MKIATQILTIYMIALSLIPCGDGGGGIVEIVNHFMGVEHQHVSDHEQHSNGCGDDTCTPFCVCSCCSITTSIPANASFTSGYFTLIYQKLPSFKSNFYSSGFLTSIWQPPRFS
jgi:hypothetical protein